MSLLLFRRGHFKTFGEFGRLLTNSGLGSFEALWALPHNLVDEPNRRGDGWSMVGRHEIQLSDGRLVGFYLKRQQNYFPRRALFPKRPLLWRECRRLRDFSKQGIPSLDVIAVGLRRTDNDCQGILVTLELTGYQCLDEMMAPDRPIVPDNVINAVARAVSHMHSCGRYHRSLYPKHIYIRQQDSPPSIDPDVRFIDLEDAFHLPILNYGRVRDLEKLNRYTPDLSAFRRLRFFYRYLGVQKLDRPGLALLKLVIKRANRVNKERSKNP